MSLITNYFSPIEFQVTLSRLPEVEFFVQKIEIPTITLNTVNVPTRYNRMNVPGDELNYGSLDLSFIIDENMYNYMSVFSWMKGLTFPEDSSQYRTLSNTKGINSDISVIVLNSHKNPNIKIDFTGAFPTSLSGVILDTTQTDVIYPSATVTFNYDYFNINLYNQT